LSIGKRKRKAIQKKKRMEKRKRGRLTPFTLANCPKQLKGICNRYEYKVNVHNCIFARARFLNVRYRSGHITYSTFKAAYLTNVDFICVNLKANKFKSTHFKNCIFFGCNLEDADFTNAVFENTYFISCKLKNRTIFKPSTGIRLIAKYPLISLTETLQETLRQMNKNHNLEKFKILTISENKNNLWLLSLLLEKYTEQELNYFFRKMLISNKHRFITYNDYESALANYYKL